MPAPAAPTGAREPPELVIFDCDGVLVDSEPISVAVLLEAIGEAGGAVSERHAWERFLGRSMASVVAQLDGEFGISLTAQHESRMRERLFERFRAELKPIPGVGEAVGALPCRRCVASSSQPERIRFSLDVAGLLALFEPHIYSASMVPHGKPAPDLFLHAARRMGVAPAACAVVEDSPAGIEAAKAAGMRALAFTGGAHAAEARLAEMLAAAGPDTVFESMGDLPALLGFAPALPAPEAV